MQLYQGEFDATEIHRVSGISREEFHQQYLEEGCPVVLEGSATNWPAVSKWNAEYLSGKVGETKVTLRHIHPEKRGHDAFELEEKELSEYLAQLDRVGRGKPYLAEEKLGDILPALVEDIGVNKYGYSKASDFYIMLGARTIAPFHFHVTAEAISTQIVGHRTFYLVPPNNTDKIKPRPLLGPMFNFTSRNSESIMGDLSSMDVLKTTLSPGDSIFIPVHWWHSVIGSDKLDILLVDFFDSQRERWKQSVILDRIKERRMEFSSTLKELLDFPNQDDPDMKDAIEKLQKSIESLPEI